MDIPMKKALLALKKPSVFVPIVLSVALIVALLSFTDLAKVLAIMSRFNRLDLLYFLLLMVVYEVIRGAQWRYFLRRLRVRAPLSTEIFAFALSEVTKALPIGNYFQNYVLHQSKGVDIGRTSAATTLIIIEEVAVSLAGVFILGLGSWTTQARVVIALGVALTAIAAWLLSHFHHEGRRHPFIERHTSLTKAAEEFGRFRDGAADLMRPGVLAVTLALSAAYLITAGAGLWLITQALSIGGVSFAGALEVYFFSLAVALILPIPIDVGVIEISGVGAFFAIGVGRNAALGVVLANRILSILASILIAGVAVLILRHEVRGVFSYETKRRETDQRREATPRGAEGGAPPEPEPEPGPRETQVSSA